MTLAERYAKAEIETLINIVENPADYTPECVQVVTQEIRNRRIETEELKDIAKALHQARTKAIMAKFDPYTDKLIPPKSNYLSEEEVLSAMKEEFDLWLEKKQGYGFDVWQYAVGGII
jgi:hypothetical protein